MCIDLCVSSSELLALWVILALEQIPQLVDLVAPNGCQNGSSDSRLHVFHSLSNGCNHNSMAIEDISMALVMMHYEDSQLGAEHSLGNILHV